MDKAIADLRFTQDPRSRNYINSVDFHEFLEIAEVLNSDVSDLFTQTNPCVQALGDWADFRTPPPLCREFFSDGTVVPIVNPIPGDFDGDGKSDTSAFRPSESHWYLFGGVGGSIGVNDPALNPFDQTPNRASLQALDGQKPIRTFMRPGKVLIVPPGRYRIKPQNFTDITAPEFTVVAGETKTIILK